MRGPHTSAESSPCSLQLEKACRQQQRPTAAKNEIKWLSYSHTIRCALFKYKISWFLVYLQSRATFATTHFRTFSFLLKVTLCPLASLRISPQLPGAQPRGPLIYFFVSISSVQFSCSVMSDSLRPHESQHTRLPCPSPTPGVYSNSCPSSRWCHPAISSSVVPFSSCPQCLPGSGSFPMSQLFTWGGQSIGVSASASVLPMNTQDWSPLGLLGSPCSPRDSQESSPTPQFRSINSSVLSFLHSPTLTSIPDHWKYHNLD